MDRSIHVEKSIIAKGDFENMALKKKLESNRGIITDYHRIANFNVDMSNAVIVVNVKSYANERI